MAMAKRSIESGKIATGKARTARYVKSPKSQAPSSPSKDETPSKRLSPAARAQSQSPSGSLRSSPRTSPGLLAGHYAGCKFSEPPLPSTLPLPPQHWMQATHSIIMPACQPLAMSDHLDIAQQLKMLLKVQA